ncbi:MAG TPA: GxxExxY protein [Blastocatellia bacterium]|jgi:GxxExxY protein
MKAFEPLPDETERIAREIVDAAFRVHTVMGPGLLEAVYEACMVHELHRRGLRVQTQVSVPISYEGVRLASDLQLDMLVEERVIVEVKAVEKMNPVFQAQLLSYLRLRGLRLGLLINFTVPFIKDGIKRVIL